MPRWSDHDIPPLQGRCAIVTGGSSGIGLAIATALARHGAAVTLTSRAPHRGDAAVARIQAAVPRAVVRAHTLDLADLHSVRAFATVMEASGPLDLLINNAGVMGHARREVTHDGFEMQLGTNHLGHFALTGWLLPTLLRAPRTARIVTVSSIAHRRGEIRFDDLQLERCYAPMRAYTQSKLANLMFALELQRRLAAHGANAMSVAAHPGIAATAIASTISAGRGRVVGAVVDAGFQLMGQTAARGALPILYAATALSVTGGRYVGPDGLREMRGDPAPAVIGIQAQDTGAAAELWRRSEQLTDVHYLGEPVQRSNVTGRPCIAQPGGPPGLPSKPSATLYTSQ